LKLRHSNTHTQINLRSIFLSVNVLSLQTHNNYKI